MNRKKNTEANSGELNELRQYLKEDNMDYKTNILSWWKGNELRYPVLALMAKDYLAVPSKCLIYFYYL